MLTNFLEKGSSDLACLPAIFESSAEASDAWGGSVALEASSFYKQTNNAGEVPRQMCCGLNGVLLLPAPKDFSAQARRFHPLTHPEMTP